MGDEKDILSAAIQAMAHGPAPVVEINDALIAAIAAVPLNVIGCLRGAPRSLEARARLRPQQKIVPIVAAAEAAASAAADDAVAAAGAAADGDAMAKSLRDARSAFSYSAAVCAGARQLADWVRWMPKSTLEAVAGAEGAIRAAEIAEGKAAAAVRRCHELVEAGYIDEDHKAVVTVAVAAAAEVAVAAAVDSCRAHTEAVMVYYKIVLASYGDNLPNPLVESMVLFPPKKKQKNGTAPTPRVCTLELGKAIHATVCILIALTAPARPPRPSDRVVRDAFVRARLRLRLFPGAMALIAECGMGQTVFKHHIDRLCLCVATRMWWATPREQWNFVCKFDELVAALKW